MATVECGDGTTFEAPCCNEDDGDSCYGDCYDAHGCEDDTCSCSAVIVSVDDLMDRDIVLKAAERSGLSDEKVAQAYHAMLSDIEPATNVDMDAEVDGGRLRSLSLSREDGSFDPTVAVRTDQRTLFDVADAGTYGDAFRAAERARRRGDLEIEPLGFATQLKFGIVGLAASLGRALGLVPDLGSDGSVK